MAARVLGLLLGFAASAALAQQQPVPNAPEPKKDTHLSERQVERIDERQRLIECNRHAREKQVTGAERHQFTRECLKGKDAAVGGGQAK